MERSIVGDLINFRGLVYAPINENGVIFLFGKVAEDFNMYIEEIKPGFPDCIARRFVGKGWERVRIEFEYLSKNFLQHGHDKDGCDIIVCWEHNWENCPIEVIELKSEIKRFENYPVQPPAVNAESGKNENIDEYFKNKLINENIKLIYKDIESRYAAVDDSVWQKYGGKYIGWYSPERSFASFLVNKSSIKVEVFCGDTIIEGTKICNEKFSPRWCRTYIRNAADVECLIVILKESQHRITQAISHGENTGYFSGGQPFGQETISTDEDETATEVA